MFTFLLKVKCFFSSLYGDIIPNVERARVLKDRVNFRIEERYVRSMAGRVRAKLIQDGVVKNLLGKAEDIMVEVAFDDHYAIASFFNTSTIRELDNIVDVQHRMRMEVVSQGSLGRQTVFRYIYRSGFLEYAHQHPERIFDPDKPLLVIQPTHWADSDIFGPIRYESDKRHMW